MIVMVTVLQFLHSLAHLQVKFPFILVKYIK